MSVLPSYRNQSIDLLANQLTGFYMRATLTFNGLNKPACFKYLWFFSGDPALINVGNKCQVL